MDKKKGTSPVTIALLGIGAVLAVLLALWNVKRALAPPTPAAATATGGAPGQTDATPGAPAIPGTEPVAARPAPSGEAGLALGADPFTPLPGMPTVPNPVLAGQPGIAAAVARATGPRSGGPGPLPPVTPIGSFTPLPTLPGSAPAPGSAARVVPAAPLEPAPTLIGTLTGERPSAVFRTDQKLVVVPVRGSLGTWQVLSVDHGAAVVKSGSRTMKLLVGGDRVPGIAEVPTLTPAIPAPAQPTPTTEPPRRRPKRRPVAEAAPLSLDEPSTVGKPRLAVGPAGSGTVQTLRGASTAGLVAEAAPSSYKTPPLVQVEKPRLTVAQVAQEPLPADPAPEHRAPLQEPGPVALAPQMSMPVAELEPEPDGPGGPPKDQVADITEE